MVCGHLDRNALARLVADLLAGDLANLVTSTEPAPVPGPRCECDEHPPAPRAPIPGALPSTSLPGQPVTTGQPGTTGQPAAPGQSAATGPVPPGLTAPPRPAPPRPEPAPAAAR